MRLPKRPVPGIVIPKPALKPMSRRTSSPADKIPLVETVAAASAYFLAFTASPALSAALLARVNAVATCLPVNWRAAAAPPVKYVKGSRAISNPIPTIKSKGPGKSTPQSLNTSPIIMLSEV